MIMNKKKIIITKGYWIKGTKKEIKLKQTWLRTTTLYNMDKIITKQTNKENKTYTTSIT